MGKNLLRDFISFLFGNFHEVKRTKVYLRLSRDNKNYFESSVFLKVGKGMWEGRPNSSSNSNALSPTFLKRKLKRGVLNSGDISFFSHFSKTSFKVDVGTARAVIPLISILAILGLYSKEKVNLTPKTLSSVFKKSA